RRQSPSVESRWRSSRSARPTNPLCPVTSSVRTRSQDGVEGAIRNQGSAPDYSARIGYDRAVQTREQRLVVGLSSNVLASHGAALRPDGIGTYTRELEHALTSEGALVRRVGAPVRNGVRLARPA